MSGVPPGERGGGGRGGYRGRGGGRGGRGNSRGYHGRGRGGSDHHHGGGGGHRSASGSHHSASPGRGHHYNNSHHGHHSHHHGPNAARHIRKYGMDSVETKDFIPRPYQIELYEAAKNSNLVIALGTGTGKTFIAAMLLKELSYQVRDTLESGGKRSVFLVPTKPLVIQQAEFIENFTELKVGRYYGDLTSFDSWKQEQWLTEFQTHNVLVMTAEIFRIIIHHGFIAFKQLNLLIFDEAHHATGAHPYAEILRCLDVVLPGDEPRIIGLSASLINKFANPKDLESEIRKLEAIYRAKCETSSDLRTLNKYGTKPKESLFYYEPHETYYRLHCAMNYAGIASALKKLKRSVDFFVDIDPLINSRDAKKALSDILYIYDTMGLYCTRFAVNEYLREFANRMVSNYMTDTTQLYATLLSSIITSFNILYIQLSKALEGLDEKTQVTKLIPPKLQALLKLLKDLGAKNSDSHSSGKHQYNPYDKMCGIIFAKQRVLAKTLACWLERVATLDADLAGIKPEYIFGHGALSGVPSSITSMSSKQQEEALRKFRAHECNLMVATSVLEEGLDVPRCNLVIRFDPPVTFREYIQSKGRARAESSQFVLFIENNPANLAKEERRITKFVGTESVLASHCHGRTVPRPEEAAALLEQDDLIEPYQPLKKDGAARVTINTAIGLVNRYCLKLPSDSFTKLAPHCTVRTTDSGKYIATLRLPINSTLRDPIVGREMTTPELAKRAAALQACIELHKEKELDDNLLPVGKEALNFFEELRLDVNETLPAITIATATVNQQEKKVENSSQVVPASVVTTPGKDPKDNRKQVKSALVPASPASKDNSGAGTSPGGVTPRPGTTKRRQYYTKRIASSLKGSPPSDGIKCYLYEFTMKLTCQIPDEQNTRGRKIADPSETTRNFGLLCTNPLPKICSFPVFTRSGETFIALEPIATQVTISQLQVDSISYFHQFCFSDVLRLEKYPMKFDPRKSGFSFYIVPVNDLPPNGDKGIDWEFVAAIYAIKDKPVEPVSEDERKNFNFDKQRYEDAVVLPWYRQSDKPQFFFYVAEIVDNLTPESPFPDVGYTTFAEYYSTKYHIKIMNGAQPLLDVDHTSARLNLLTPRYVNRKGITLPTSTAKTKKEKRENLQQKQILIPELCIIHPFPASLWRKAVCLPCILYRVNALLIAEELRQDVAALIGVGHKVVPDEWQWPKLDFGWTLAEVLAEDKSARLALKDAEDDEDDDGDLDWAITSAAGEADNHPPSCKAHGPHSNKPRGGAGGPNKRGHNRNRFSKDRPPKKASDDDGLMPMDFVIDTFDPEIYKVPGDPPTKPKVKDEPKVPKPTPAAPAPAASNPAFPVFTLPSDINNKSRHTSGLSSKCSDVEDDLYQRMGTPSGFESDNDSINWDWANHVPLGLTAMMGDLSIPGLDYISGTSEINIQGLQQDLQNNIDLFDDMDDDDSDAEFLFGSDLDDLDDDEVMGGDGSGSPGPGRSMPFSFQPARFNKSSINPRAESLLENDGDMEGYKLYSEDERREMNQDQVDCGVSDMDEIKIKLPTVRERFSIYRGSSQPATSTPNNSQSGESRVGSQEVGDETSYHTCLSQENISRSYLEDDLRSLASIADQDQLNETRESLSQKSEQDEANKDKPVSSPPRQQGKIEANFGELLPGRETITIISTHGQPMLDIRFDPLVSETNVIDIGPSPALILQALTMSNASDGINLERLETVGDSFLKYAVTAFLFCMCPTIHEGRLSYLRSKQISNLNLYSLGRKKELGEIMMASKFEPGDNWLPPGYVIPAEMEDMFRKLSIDAQKREAIQEGEVLHPADTLPYNLLTEHSIPDKSVADCVEALIGAYLISSGPRGALLFMKWLGLHVMRQVNQADANSNSGSLRSISNGRNIALHAIQNDLNESQRSDASDSCEIWHWLPPVKSPLLIPRTSDSQGTEGEQLVLRELNRIYRGSMMDLFESDIGYAFRDKSYLVQAFTHNSYSDNHVTDCYQRLEFLGDAVLDYLITRYLFEDPQNHSPGILTDLRSALVNNTFFARLAVKYSFHKYLKVLSNDLFRVIQEFVAKCTQEGQVTSNERFDDCLYLAEGETENAEEIEVPKALGDVFESVAGAIYLDSGKSLDAVWRVYFQMMKPEIEYYSNHVPKSPIRELLEMEPQNAKFGKPELISGRKIRVCVEVFGEGKFFGVGRNKRIAKCTAAKRALRMLKKRRLPAASSTN